MKINWDPDRKKYTEIDFGFPLEIEEVRKILTDNCINARVLPSFFNRKSKFLIDFHSDKDLMLFKLKFK